MLTERPLRICLLSYRSSPHCGGQGVYLKNLSRALKDQGHWVEVVSGPPDPQLDRDIPVHHLEGLDLYNAQDPFRLPRLRELSDPVNLWEWLSISSGSFPEPFTFGVRAYRFLHRKLRRFDVIHDNQSLSYGLWALGRLTPFVATIHHPITVDRDLAVAAAPSAAKRMQQRRWYSFLGMQKRVSRTCGHLITVSQASRGDISREFRVPAGRIKVVPNGVRIDLFRPLKGVAREPGRVIVTNSADTPLKGLPYLLMAVARVAREREIKLVVIGMPKKKGVVAGLVKELDLGERVKFTGRVSDQELVRQYARASLAVVPSLYEGFGLPAGEAMACGVPVISTTGGALPEVVGDAGRLVPPADAEALAQALIELLDDPAQAEALGRAGYARALKHFTWERAAQATSEVYREAIHAHRGLQ